MLRRSIAGILLFPVCLSAQKTDEKKALAITLHVTSVRQEEDLSGQYCEPKDCQATTFTVEGYADREDQSSRTEYVLACTQAMRLKPSPRVVVSCGSIHADNDYQGRMFDNSISFWPAGKYTPPPYRGLWAIQSEKVTSRKG
jgi:hypothetical protein